MDSDRVSGQYRTRPRIRDSDDASSLTRSFELSSEDGNSSTVVDGESPGEYLKCPYL